jgi:hypothetical protein
LNERSKVVQTRHREGLLSAISAGFFFILVGTIFITTPNLFNNIITFFSDFSTVRVSNTQIYLPAPKYPPTSPSANSAVYSAVGQFSLIWGLFEIIILVLRFFVGSPLSKKAETVSNIVFWLGANYLIQTFLNETTTITTWFVFWTTIIMLLGASLIARAVILAAAR